MRDIYHINILNPKCFRCGSVELDKTTPYGVMCCRCKIHYSFIRHSYITGCKLPKEIVFKAIKIVCDNHGVSTYSLAALINIKQSTAFSIKRLIVAAISTIESTNYNEVIEKIFTNRLTDQDPLIFPSKKPRGRLSNKDISKIRSLHKNKKITAKQLAADYKYHISGIYLILKKQSYRRKRNEDNQEYKSRHLMKAKDKDERNKSGIKESFFKMDKDCKIPDNFSKYTPV